MHEKLTPNNFVNDEYNESTKDIDYKDLINRLIEIKTTITLLEKTVLI